MRICTKSVMDDTDPDIIFDNDGVSNHYYEYFEKRKNRVFQENEGKNSLKGLIATIKNKGKNQDYDCLIGVSGGVDSTYVAYLTKELGLRPLAIHFDNGWNSELAVKNIEKTLKKLNIDLITYVIDWEEFKDIQLSFLKSSTPDGEIPTDHAIFALLFRTAAKHNIKYVLNGNNFMTEGIMPACWSYGHIDWKYIKSIHKKFGSKKLKTYPKLTLLNYLYYFFIRRVQIISILNYMKYDKEEAMSILKERLDWKYYGGKHYESVYTRFYQGYILPKKFNIDKRKAHLSALILDGQISREEALELLKEPIYPIELFEDDQEYVLKKLDLSRENFNEIMDSSHKTYRAYPNSSSFHGVLRKALNTLRRLKILYS